MADELQALLDRIDRDGIKKAETEQNRIIVEAQAEAEAIRRKAHEEAEALVASAKAECETIREKGEQALRQSARQVMLEVRAELEKRVSQAAVALMRETLQGERLGEVVARLCQSYLEKEGSTDELTILLPPADVALVESAVKARLAAVLQERVTLAPLPELAAGFRLAFKGDEVTYDFSDESLAESLAAHVSPVVAAALTAK